MMTLAELQADLDVSPFHRLFQIKVDEIDLTNRRLVLRQAFTPSVERMAATGQYHGGVIASLVDIAGDYALMSILGFAVPTIDLRVDYLARAVDSDLLATATVRKAGRTVGVVDIEVTDDRGRLVAVGRGCYATAAG